LLAAREYDRGLPGKSRHQEADWQWCAAPRLWHVFLPVAFTQKP
jgi:hypothetical protein